MTAKSIRTIGWWIVVMVFVVHYFTIESKDSVASSVSFKCLISENKPKQECLCKRGYVQEQITGVDAWLGKFGKLKPEYETGAAAVCSE